MSDIAEQLASRRVDDVIVEAQRHQRGPRLVVDVDLEELFDRVMRATSPASRETMTIG